MRFIHILAASAAVGAVMTAPAFAAEKAPASASSANQLQEIIVTATRREQTLQTIPIAVTAVSGADLKRSDVHDIKGLQFMAPSLHFGGSTGDRTTLLASMRGIYVSESLSTLDPAVGVYLNGVYIARTTGLNLALVDIQRVEVLRGPQGTLFGRNTMGGAINILPVEPTHDFTGSLGGAVGNFDTRRITGVVNVPMGEHFAARVAAEHSENSGWGRNTRLNKPLNDDNVNFLRVSLKGDVGPLTALVVYDFSKLTGGSQLSKVIFANPCGGPNSTGPCSVPPFAGHPEDAGLAKYINTPFYENQGDNWGPFIAKAQGVSGVLTYDLGGVATAKSITAYRTTLRRSYTGYDIDGTPYGLLQTTGSGVKQFEASEEFQIYGKALDNRLDWIGGLYYFNEQGHDGLPTGATLNLFPLSQTLNIQDGQALNKSVGAFGQVTYAVMDNLKFTAGIRYTKDKRQLISRNRNNFPPNEQCLIAASLVDVPGVCRVTLPVKTFSYKPWTLGVDWTPVTDTLVYGKISRGFRAGGYNLRGTSAVTLDTFGPESAMSYEVGVKSSLLDRRLRVNAAVFDVEYHDIQVVRQVPTGIGLATANRVDNAARARIRGGELEVQAVVTESLKLSMSGSYTDPKYTAVLPGAAVQLTDRFLGVAKKTLSLAADYHLDAPMGATDLHAEYDWRSRVWYSQNLVGSQPAYGIVNGTIAFHPSSNDKLSFQAYGRNLLGKKYYDRVLDQTTNAIGIAIGVQAAPRMYGISANYEF